MTLHDIIGRLELTVLAGGDELAHDVTRGYASDLLSDVLANGRESDVWVTLQTHKNIVAVASLRDLAGILLVSGRQPDPETVAAARREGIPLLTSTLPAFELVGRLYQMGISGAESDAEGI